MSTVYLNGRFLSLEEATVPVMDRGFLFGDGVYEVIPVYDRQPFRLDEHLTRLQDSLAGIRLANPHTAAEWSGLVARIVAASPWPDAGIYLQVTRGPGPRDHAFPRAVHPTVLLMPMELAPPPAELVARGVAAITAEDNRWSRCDLKTTSLLANVLLRQLSVDAGCAETILVRGGQLERATPPPFATPAELVVALENCASGLKADGEGRDPRQQIDAILARVTAANAAWLKRGDVATALGYCFGEARCWTEAIAALDDALRAEVGEASLGVIEQRANYRVRLAAAGFGALTGADAKNPDAKARALKKRIREAIADLEHLRALGDTMERLHLLGAAYKRLALLHALRGEQRECVTALNAMARHYRAALDKARALGDRSPSYSYTNWATAVLLAGIRQRKPTGAAAVELDDSGAALFAASRIDADEEPDFWESLAAADYHTLRLLADAPRLAADGKALAALSADAVRAYHDAIARGASPRQVSSVRENLEFLVGVLRGPGRPTPRIARIVDCLTTILESLERPTA